MRSALSPRGLFYRSFLLLSKASVIFYLVLLQIEILVFFYDLFRCFPLLVVSDPHDQED